eukprot:jgi/Mesen1/9964/ME000072S09379
MALMSCAPTRGPCRRQGLAMLLARPLICLRVIAGRKGGLLAENAGRHRGAAQPGCHACSSAVGHSQATTWRALEPARCHSRSGERQMGLHTSKSPAIALAEREAGWTLIAALVVSLPPETSDHPECLSFTLLVRGRRAGGGRAGGIAGAEEHELELMTMWALPFGGNCVECVKGAIPNLALELSFAFRIGVPN